MMHLKSSLTNVLLLLLGSHLVNSGDAFMLPIQTRSVEPMRNVASHTGVSIFEKRLSGTRSTIPLQMAQSGNLDNDTSWPLDRPALALVDAASLLLFAGVGKASHAPDGSLDVGAVAITALPFLVAWFSLSPLTGVYQQTRSVAEAGKLAAKGWIIAVPLGCVLRGLIKGYVPPVPFVIVTLIATLVLLGGSRMLFYLVEDKLQSQV